MTVTDPCETVSMCAWARWKVPVGCSGLTEFGGEGFQVEGLAEGGAEIRTGEKNWNRNRCSGLDT